MVHQLSHLFVISSLDEIRINLFDASYSMYCAFMTILMFEQLNAMCGNVSVFLHIFWPLVLHFSLIFPFLCIFFLFNFRSRVCFFSELPFSVLHSLVSPSCSYFFFGSSTVDYSIVRVACPSIAFFFAHLGYLLESVGGSVLRELVPS